MYIIKAGDGNRTHVSSLEGWCSTIELHPQSAQNRNRTSDTRIFSPLLYRLSYEAKKIMAVPTGFEPAIFCVTGRRDRPLHHGTMVAGAGFEPTTSGLWAQRATGLLHPAIKLNINGGGKGIRTPAPLSRPPGFQDRSLQPDLGIPP